MTRVEVTRPSGGSHELPPPGLKQPQMILAEVLMTSFAQQSSASHLVVSEGSDGDQGDGARLLQLLVELLVEEPNRAVARGSRTQSWQPKTLMKNWTPAVDGAGGGKVELVHTCGNGQRVSVMLSPPDVPPRANHMFNADAKRTMKALV